MTNYRTQKKLREDLRILFFFQSLNKLSFQNLCNISLKIYILKFHEKRG